MVADTDPPQLTLMEPAKVSAPKSATPPRAPEVATIVSDDGAQEGSKAEDAASPGTEEAGSQSLDDGVDQSPPGALVAAVAASTCSTMGQAGTDEGLKKR